MYKRQVQQQPRPVDLDGAVGEHRLDHLETPDRRPELLTLAGVVSHVTEQPRRLADRPRTDLGQPDATQCGEGQAQAVALAADEGLGPEVDVVERCV